MRYAVFTVSLPEYTPAEAVQTLRDIGYDGIEWRVFDQEPAQGAPDFWVGNRCTWPLSSVVADAPQMRALAESAGLAMPSLGTYALCNDLAAVELAMQGASLLGVPQLRINVPLYDGSLSYMKLRDTSRAQYRDVAALAQCYNVRALIEMHHGSLTPSASAAAAFLAGFDPRYVGTIYDAGNMVHEGYEQYRMGLELLGPYLAHVHIKNTHWKVIGTRPDGSSEWKSDWAPIPHGVVDMEAQFRALRSVGYDGWVSVEDFSTEQPLRERLQINLAYIKQVVQRVAEDEG
jgi:sugar phosphate isomerase/epimerase